MRERKLCCWQFSWFSSVVHWLLAHVATISHCIPNVVLQLFEARLFRQKVLLQLAESAVWARQWHEPCSFKSGHSPCCRIVNSCSSLCITLGVSLCSCSCSWSCHKAQNFFGLYEGLDMNTKKKLSSKCPNVLAPDSIASNFGNCDMSEDAAHNHICLPVHPSAQRLHQYGTIGVQSYQIYSNECNFGP